MAGRAAAAAVGGLAHVTQIGVCELRIQRKSNDPVCLLLTAYCSSTGTFIVRLAVVVRGDTAVRPHRALNNNNKLVFALNVRNQHANTDARLSPAPHDIVVVYWRQRHTRLGPPSPSLYGHSGHGLTHNTETMQSITYARLSRLPLY